MLYATTMQDGSVEVTEVGPEIVATTGDDGTVRHLPVVATGNSDADRRPFIMLHATSGDVFTAPVARPGDAGWRQAPSSATASTPALRSSTSGRNSAAARRSATCSSPSKGV